jgi:hypothetical protein
MVKTLFETKEVLSTNARCSHSNFLIQGPYPILNALEEKSAIRKIRKVWKEALLFLFSSLVPNLFWCLIKAFEVFCNVGHVVLICSFHF